MRNVLIRHIVFSFASGLGAVALSACGGSPSQTTPSALPAQSDAIARVNSEAQPVLAVKRVINAGQTPGYPGYAFATDITAGPDGSMWFIDRGTPAIGKISATGEISEYTTGLNRRTILQSIVAGADGNMWFSDAWGSIGRVTPSGAITEFSIASLSKQASPEGIAVDPNGVVWSIAPYGKNILVRSDSQGNLTAFELPHGLVPDGSLAADRQGNLWMMTMNGQYGVILEREANGTFVRHPTGLQAAAVMCCPNISPKRIAIGEDGRVWFTTTYWLDPKISGLVIGETTASTTQMFRLNRAGVTLTAYPSGITADDGQVWFTGDDPFQNNGALWTTSSTGVQPGYSLPYSPIAIAAQPSGDLSSGNLWITTGAFGNPSQIIELSVMR